MDTAETEHAIALPDGRETIAQNALVLLIALDMVFATMEHATASMDGEEQIVHNG